MAETHEHNIEHELHHEHGNMMAFMMGIVFLILALFLFIYYLLPLARGTSPQFTIPSKIDININQRK